jgi:NAD-dependent SIR2 family protein deacetylase
VDVGDVADLAALVAAGRVVVLTGAGISTASGIPDYRGTTGRSRTAPPMQWDEFVGSAAARRRYWARGQVGFRRYEGIRPNPAHEAVAALEHAGLVDAVVTQNVDGLHRAAGSRSIVELHGALADVLCMACGTREPRGALQARLDAANPWLREVDAPQQADGDAVLDETHIARFEAVGCLDCDGPLRPDVVFFGEFVPRERMARARDLVEGAMTLLVAGTSLAVGSGRLLLRHARRHGAAVAIVNLGPTRADSVADVRIEADVTDVLPRLAERVGVGGAPPGPTAG